MSNDYIEIDGSFGEGGGQVIRTALTMSAITKKPIRISKIRAKRPNPGFAAQHVTCAQAVRTVCRGTLEGAEKGSKELIFTPGEIVGGKYDFDIGTAGSTTLVAQTLIPILLHASKPSEILITGGTHVMKSPGYDYFEQVFLPAISKFGAPIKSTFIKPGYYPAGGGQMKVEVESALLQGVTSWPFSSVINVVIRLSELPSAIAVREKKIFVQNSIEAIRVQEDPASSPGNSVTAWCGFRGSYVLGEQGKRAKVVAQEVLDNLMAEEEDIDKHLADQLLIYAALAKGKTEYRTSKITEHLRTNLNVITRFVDRKIKIDGVSISVE